MLTPRVLFTVTIWQSGADERPLECEQEEEKGHQNGEKNIKAFGRKSGQKFGGKAN
jgi:hypothetical protein